MKVKVLQWNVWYKENPTNIAKEILRINPDIICAQELMTNKNNYDSSKSISSITGYKYVYAEGDTWDNREDKQSQGNAIFSKFPLIESQQIYLTSKKHNPLNATVEGRVYLENKYAINDKIITIATTHLGYSHKFRSTKIRLTEYNNLDSILKSKNQNFIFCADLNSGTNGKIRKEVSKHLVNAGPKLCNPTWTTKPFDYHGFKEDKLKYRIDYVFSTNDMNISKSTIINTKFSDHLPILVEFEI